MWVNHVFSLYGGERINFYSHFGERFRLVKAFKGSIKCSSNSVSYRERKENANKFEETSNQSMKEDRLRP